MEIKQLQEAYDKMLEAEKKSQPKVGQGSPVSPKGSPTTKPSNQFHKSAKDYKRDKKVEIDEEGVAAPAADFTTAAAQAQYKVPLGKKVTEADAAAIANAKRAAGDALVSAAGKVKSKLETNPEEALNVLEDEDPEVDMGAEAPEADLEDEQDVLSKILAAHPGAVITISVQLPEETPFSPETMASAQEVAGEPEAAESELTTSGPEGDMGEITEKRSWKIAEARSKVKKIFKALTEEEGMDDVAAAIGGSEAPEVDPAALDGDTGPKPEIEVSDNKIALAPEQWEQVLATAEVAGPETGEIEELVNVGNDLQVEQSDSATGDVSVDEEPKIVAEEEEELEVDKPLNESTQIAEYAKTLQKALKG